jgi:hypothetical protein
MKQKNTSTFTVEFVPVPPEMEEAYWFAIRYFAQVMRANLLEDVTEPEDTEQMMTNNKKCLHPRPGMKAVHEAA